MLRLSRRQLLKTTAISTALVATPQSVLAASREKLTIPPLMEAKRGRPIILNMEETGYKLDGAHSVSVWGLTAIILPHYSASNRVPLQNSIIITICHKALPSLFKDCKPVANYSVVRKSPKKRGILGTDYPNRPTCFDLLVSLCHPGKLGLSNLSRHRRDVVD